MLQQLNYDTGLLTPTLALNISKSANQHIIKSAHFPIFTSSNYQITS